MLTAHALVAASAEVATTSALQVVLSPVAIVGGGLIGLSVDRRTQGDYSADDDKDNAARITNVAQDTKICCTR